MREDNNVNIIYWV